LPLTTDSLDALLAIRDGYPSARWNFWDAVGTSVSSPGGIGNVAAVTFSFLTSIPSFPSYSNVTGFAQFSELQQQAAREVLAFTADIVQLSFSEMAGVGDITFAMNTQSGSAGYAYYPTFGYSYDGDGTIVSVYPIDEAGDIWLNSSLTWTTDDFVVGGSGYGNLVHELGHALGLKHPFEANTSEGYTLEESLDSNKYTVMSYTEHSYSLYRTVTETSPGSYSLQYENIQPETFMPLDIVALQYLYGSNTSFHAGNDIYTFDTSRPFIQTIWDGGGTDTISVSNFSLGCVLDLRDGYFSSITILSDPLPAGVTESHSGIYDGTDNLAIAYGAIIENAIGGTGNDQLTGNTGPNVLNGGGGIDTMAGGLGNDTYIVNITADIVTELAGQGIDTIKSNITYSLVDTDGAGSNGGNVEKLVLTGTAAINGTGNVLANTLTGNSAANVLNGGGGADTMIGGLGNDTYIVNLAADRITELAGQGTDTIKSSVTYSLLDTDGAGSNGGHVENLTLTGTAAINGTGNSLNNVLTGNTKANVLNGGSGADSINGGAGNDKLLGGAGNDILTGGAGQDIFFFSTALTNNVDTIIDFSALDDTIQLKNTIFTKLTTTETLSSNNFLAGTGMAVDANDYILYNSTSGALYYDSDGNGSGVAIQFASLTGNPVITNSDFLVV